MSYGNFNHWTEPGILDLIWYFIFGHFLGSDKDETIDYLKEKSVRKKMKQTLSELNPDWQEGDQFK